MKQRLIFELRYLQDQAPWDTGISPTELLATLNRLPPGRALDLGCGTGTNAIAMAARGWKVTALDFSLIAILSARRKAVREGFKIDFRRRNILNLTPPEEPFDLVLDLGCFHSIAPADRQRYAENLAGLLAPKGTFLLYTWIQQPDSDDPRQISESQIADLFDFADLVEIQRGQDSASGRASAWITLQRHVI